MHPYDVLKEIFETPPVGTGNRAAKTWEDNKETFEFDELIDSQKLQLDEHLKIVKKAGF